jgi:putative spermidine/putrescine transport system substrate-binding protein
MAPKESQNQVKPAIRDSYEKAIKDLPAATQLDSKPLVEAMDMWDKLVGAKIKK